MDENPIVNADTLNGEDIDTSVVADSSSGDDAVALKAKVAELADKNSKLFERAKKAEGFEKVDGKWVKAAKPVTPQSTVPTPKTGEAEDTTALLLEVKGITADDEVELFQKWSTDTGRKPREILNNSIFQAELAARRAEKATQAAIPSSNGRGGGGGAQNIDALTEKFERTGELPKDFETKAKIIERVAAKENSSTPWRR
jgi:hypothetical protein